MPSLDYIRSLFDYNAWANVHVLDAAASLTVEDLRKDLGASFGSVRGNLVHLVWAQGIWLLRFSARGGPPAIDDGSSLGDIRDAYAASHEAFGGYLASLSEEQLVEKISYTDTRGNSYEPPLWQPLVHLVNHGTHHRAECAMLLTSLASPPRQLDYMFFELERDGAPPRLT